MTGINWNEGMSAKAIKATEAKFVQANRHVKEGEASLLRAGRELRIVLNTYLKKDRAKFEAAASELFDRSASAAYEYVQAADAFGQFSDAIKATGTDVSDVGVRTLAKLDRFTGTDDKVAEGLEVIKAEAKRAKAEGTKAFTNEGLKATIRTVKGEGEATGTDDERKASRIATKYRDDLRSEFIRAEAIRTEHGNRAAFVAAIRLGATWGSASGALTPQAITKLVIEWAADDKVAEAEAKKVDKAAKAKLAEAERVAAAVETLRPKRQAKATVQAIEAKVTAKRANRKATPSIPVEAPEAK